MMDSFQVGVIVVFIILFLGLVAALIVASMAFHKANKPLNPNQRFNEVEAASVNTANVNAANIIANRITGSLFMEAEELVVNNAIGLLGMDTLPTPPTENNGYIFVDKSDGALYYQGKYQKTMIAGNLPP